MSYCKSLGIFLIVLFTSCISHNKHNAKIYLLREGYQGSVLIIYTNGKNNVQTGPRCDTCLIPNDGVLITSEGPTSDRSIPKVYYLDSLKKRIEIPYMSFQEYSALTDSTKIFCFNMEKGITTIRNSTIHFVLFSVSDKLHYDSITRKRSPWMGSMFDLKKTLVQ